jgi:hypothetical protein
VAEDLKMYIDGEWVEASDGSTLDVLKPRDRTAFMFEYCGVGPQRSTATFHRWTRMPYRSW